MEKNMEVTITAGVTIRRNTVFLGNYYVLYMTSDCYISQRPMVTLLYHVL